MKTAKVREQQHLDASYKVLDQKLAEARAKLLEVGQLRTSHAQNRLEGEAMQQHLVSRIAAISAAERRLCFGRLDTCTGESLYVGRIGLSDDDQLRLQLDWRAPAAAPFYQASARTPLGLVRRRHLSTDQRLVTSITDDVFDQDAVEASDDPAVLSGDSALLQALGRARTGKMHEIVETIQAEQDAVIRYDAPGVLVVQGGPGTGKTVVALHRAAYLLYRDRARLERSGVLIVGPSRRFLSYIDEVLPSLGETGVLLATPSDLFPGVDVTLRDPAPTQALKSDLRMAQLVARAVEQRRQLPTENLRIRIGSDLLTLTPRAVQAATRRALDLDSRPNVVRDRFLRHLMDQLVTDLARRRGIDAGDRDERDELFQEIRESADARRVLNRLWMPIDPQRLLTRLYTEPAFLASASLGILSEQEQQLLLRTTVGFSEADVPLLDEIAELSGDLPDLTAQRSFTSKEWEDASAAAAGLGLSARDLLDRYSGSEDHGVVSERALLDREWRYGHLIVDEAQELSPMQWRMLARRVSSRSMTVVGDMAQSSTPGAAQSWSAALDPFAKGAWRLMTLSVNYRTPVQIARVADRFLLAHGRQNVSDSVREGLSDPLFVNARDLLGTLPGVLQQLQDTVPGLAAVVAPSAQLEQLQALGVANLFSAQEVKGLEFDNVVLLDPAELLAESGPGALFVALTRATQQMAVLYPEALPVGLHP